MKHAALAVIPLAAAALGLTKWSVRRGPMPTPCTSGAPALRAPRSGLGFRGGQSAANGMNVIRDSDGSAGPMLLEPVIVPSLDGSDSAWDNATPSGARQPALALLRRRQIRSPLRRNEGSSLAAC